MKKYISTLFVALFFCTINFSQNVDIFGISYAYNPKVGLMNPPVSALENTDLDVSELKFNFLLPTPLKNGSTTIINGLEWHFVNAFFDQLPDDYSFEANLHSFQYKFGINQQFNEKWGVRFLVQPTLASNFKNGISGDDFYLQGSLVVHHAINNGLRIGAGAAYTNGFGEPKMVPVLNVKYKTEKFDLDILAPVKMSAKYYAGNLLVGLKAEVDGNQYHLQFSDEANPKTDNLDAVKFSRYNVGPVVGWTIEGQGRVELSAGVSLNRIFKVVDVNDAELDYDLNNGFFVKTGFYFGK